MTKNFSIKFFTLIILSLVLGFGQAFAQSTVTGGINGTITDPQGGVVPNASITVTNIGTNAAVTVNASSDGGYRVLNLQPGTYRVETTVSGFAPVMADNIIVEVGVITSVDIPLTLGTATAEVEITAEAPVINTNDSTNSRNINETSINELPINGRRASSFVLATPGVSPDGGFGLISFRGISGLLNNSTVDGGDDNQAFFSEARGRTRISSSISQDAVREFQVNTSNYSAEFGRAAGGVVNTVTKSGTNDFHGSAFYFFRDNKYGARNPLIFPGPGNPTGKPKDVRHQFGGSIGGPVVKDNLFFFFSYDQQKRDFPGVAQPGNATFLNPITVAGLTPAQVAAGISYLQNLTGVVPRRGDQTLILPKIDWVINDKHTFTAVYNRLRWNSPAGVQTAATVTRGRTSFGSDIVALDSYNFRLNSVLTPSIINEARFQYSRDLEQQIADTPDPSEPTTGGGFPPSASIGGGGGITIGKPNFLNRNAYPDEKRWQFADSVTLNRGKHTIKFGADINHVSDTLASLFTESGAYSYSTLANFLLDFNIPSTKAYANFQQGFGPLEFQFVTRDYNFFYQHDIRVDSNLTLNIGLRYEYQQKPEPQLPNPREPRTSVFPADKNNFGPRVGFAYSFGDNNENVIRSGYGMFYGRITNSAISNAITNTGLAAGQRTFFTTPNATSPTYPNVLPAFPSSGSSFGGDIIVFARGIQNPRIHQLDLIYERQISRNTAISFTGMISHGQYLPYFIDTNLNPPTAATAFTFNGGPLGGTTFIAPRFTGPRPNTNFGRITEISSNVSSDYYGFVAQLNRRMTNGIQFQTSYTFSSAEDNGQNSQTFTTANSPLNPFDLDIERGRSNFDVPHRFVASVIFAPTNLFGLGNGSRVGKAILGGWSVAPIVTASSGFTYSGTTQSSIIGLTSSGVLGAGGSSRIPGLAPNTFRTPSIFNIDLRLSKRFRFTETMNLEFLAEAFNLLNRFHTTGINSTMYNFASGSTTQFNFNPTFGSVTAAGNSIVRERQIQFAARFQF
ncbi:MAG: carboxypeptidase regulatory-like domain-containing protein [Acidobacteriota bacterium]|nr:carboxypeptidase regulatory-like domain-containing protein [Acidobacteriota bacterium]